MPLHFSKYLASNSKIRSRFFVSAAAISGFLILASACGADGKDSLRENSLDITNVPASASLPPDSHPPKCFESVRDALFGSDAIPNGIQQAIDHLPPLPPDATDQQRAERNRLVARAKDAGRMGAEMDFAQTGADSDDIQTVCDNLSKAAKTSASGAIETPPVENG